jgi:DNA-binding beta-propeller fold protein YncE
MGIAVSPSGDRIYVTETEGERVVRVFDGKGNPVGTMGPPSTTGTEHVPVYLALDPQNGDVYVSDRPTGSIYVYSGDGVFRRTLRPRDPKLAGWQPLGLAFDAQGQLWVTDFSGPYNRVHAITRDGQVVRTIGEPGMFSFPNGVAVDASGNVYVTDSNHGRLMVFDPAGKQRSLIPQGSAAGDLGIPKGAAIDDSGRLYVVDTTAHQVQLYRVLGEGDRQPKYIGSFGVEGVGDGGFEFPFGVATDARSRVYVADWNNNRVQVWSY